MPTFMCGKCMLGLIPTFMSGKCMQKMLNRMNFIYFSFNASNCQLLTEPVWLKKCPVTKRISPLHNGMSPSLRCTDTAVLSRITYRIREWIQYASDTVGYALDTYLYQRIRHLTDEYGYPTVWIRISPPWPFDTIWWKKASRRRWHNLVEGDLAKKMMRSGGRRPSTEMTRSGGRRPREEDDVIWWEVDMPFRLFL